MIRLFVSSILVTLLAAFSATAQQSPTETQTQDASPQQVWIQVEAVQSLTRAEQRAQAYAGELKDVAGFSLGNGWYGIAIGPYAEADAARVLDLYKSLRQIPNDSYLTDNARLGQQFWPVERTTATATPPPAAVAPAQTQQPEAQAAAPAPEPEPTPADETPAEARKSERALDRDQRKALQVALKWTGFYNSTIDGAFGRGTRGSMSAWQEAKGFEATGVLTTKQRAVLLDDYNRPLTSVGMATIEDADAGIAMQIPAGAVKFAKYEPPFAHYEGTGDVGARVLLISQAGDQATLFGLYDIMQTLEIVPLEGPRNRKKNSFTIEGRNSEFVSYTQAAMKDGHIKGFTLIWPLNDEERRTRVLDEMKASFKALPAVLDPSAGAGSEQNIDLVSGLEIRKPSVSRSGFFIDNGGTVVTTADAVQSCGRITLDGEYDAEVVHQNADLGIALLRPSQSLAPAGVASFAQTSPRLQSQIAVAGYSFGGVLGAPTLTYGVLADVKGLRGEENLKRLAMAHEPGDAGGPILDAAGGVVGMLLPRQDEGPTLPRDVSFGAKSGAIMDVLSSAGVAASHGDATAALLPQDLIRKASDITVLVSCWD